MTHMRSLKEKGASGVFGALLILGCLLLTGCGAVELASGLAEGEAQEVVVALQQFGLDAVKEKVGEGKEATWTIVVPAEQAASANQILKRYELPRKKPRGLNEVFSAAGLIPTATEEKAMMLMALQGEIAQTLETIDGIVSARVHIVIPEKNPLAETPQTKAAGSVMIKYREGSLPVTPEEIKQIVSHSVDGLEPDQVAVVMKPIVIDFAKKVKPTQKAGLIGAQTATPIIIVLAAVCLILAIVLVVLVMKLQKEKSRYLQLLSHAQTR